MLTASLEQPIASGFNTLHDAALSIKASFSQRLQQLTVQKPGEAACRLQLLSQWQEVPTFPGVEVFHIPRSCSDTEPVDDPEQPHINAVSFVQGATYRMIAHNHLRITCMSGALMINGKEVSACDRSQAEYYMTRGQEYEFEALKPTYIAVKYLPASGQDC